MMKPLVYKKQKPQKYQNNNKKHNNNKKIINTNTNNDIKPLLDHNFKTPHANIISNSQYQNFIRQNSAPKLFTKCNRKNIHNNNNIDKDKNKIQNSNNFNNKPNNFDIQNKQNICRQKKQTRTRINSSKNYYNYNNNNTFNNNHHELSPLSNIPHNNNKQNNQLSQRKNNHKKENFQQLINFKYNQFQNNYLNLLKQKQKIILQSQTKSKQYKQIVQHKQQLRTNSRIKLSNLQNSQKNFINQILDVLYYLKLAQNQNVNYQQILRILYHLKYITYQKQQHFKSQVEKEQLKKVYLIWISLINPLSRKNNKRKCININQQKNQNQNEVRKCRLINIIIFILILQAQPIQIENINGKLNLNKSQLKKISSSKSYITNNNNKFDNLNHLPSFPSSQIDKIFDQQKEKQIQKQEQQFNQVNNEPQFIFFVQKRKFKFNQAGIALLQLQRERIVNQFSILIKNRLSYIQYVNNNSENNCEEQINKNISQFNAKPQIVKNKTSYMKSSNKQNKSKNKQQLIIQKGFKKQYKQQIQAQNQQQQSQEDSDYNYYYNTKNQDQKPNYFKQKLQQQQTNIYRLNHHNPKINIISPKQQNRQQSSNKNKKRSKSHSNHNNDQNLDLLILSRPKPKSRTKTSDQIQFQKQYKQYTFHPSINTKKDAGYSNICNSSGLTINNSSSLLNLKISQSNKIITPKSSHIFNQQSSNIQNQSQKRSSSKEKQKFLNKVRDVDKTILRMQEARNIKNEKQQLQKSGWTRGSKNHQQYQTINLLKGKQNSNKQKILLLKNTNNQQTEQKCFKKLKKIHIDNVGVTTSEAVSQRTTLQIGDKNNNCQSQQLRKQVCRLLAEGLSSQQVSPKLNKYDQQKFDTFPQQKQSNIIDDNKNNILKQLPIPKQAPSSLPLKSDQFRIPILYIDVNIQQGKKERIIIYDGDKAQELARAFGAKHDLDSQTIERLQRMLQHQINSVLSRIEEQTQQESFIG